VLFLVSKILLFEEGVVGGWVANCQLERGWVKVMDGGVVGILYCDVWAQWNAVRKAWSHPQDRETGQGFNLFLLAPSTLPLSYGNALMTQHNKLILVPPSLFSVQPYAPCVHLHLLMGQ